MSTHTASPTQLLKLNESTISVIKELSGIVTLFACAAVPTLLLALRWTV